MLVKIVGMIGMCIQAFGDIEKTGHPWTRFFEGGYGLCLNLQEAPTRQILMGLYARVIFLCWHIS